jgi:hypothetical protein
MNLDQARFERVVELRFNASVRSNRVMGDRRFGLRGLRLGPCDDCRLAEASGSEPRDDGRRFRNRVVEHAQTTDTDTGPLRWVLDQVHGLMSAMGQSSECAAAD